MIKVYYALFDIETEKEIDIASAKRKSYTKELKTKVKYILSISFSFKIFNSEELISFVKCKDSKL